MSDKIAIAGIKVEGEIVTVTFANDATVVAKIGELPAAQAAAATAYGLSTFLRTSYSNSENVDEAVADVQRRLDALRAGTWMPNTRSASTKEPDDLTRAVCEARGITPEVYETQFLPWWLAPRTQETTTRDGKQRTIGTAKAMAELRAHPQIAPLLARYANDRARAGKGKEAVSLDFSEPARQAAE